MLACPKMPNNTGLYQAQTLDFSYRSHGELLVYPSITDITSHEVELVSP